ncbi:MAG: DUF1653 domain-containing protein [Clostridia bacterium]|nr:DUF1653 domain-containing protein [Clostridia bacterium]
MNEFVINGIYEHYKGNKYQLIGIANHSETLEKMVIYKALYDEEKLWVRPASMWNETVEADGKRISRFSLISDN